MADSHEQHCPTEEQLDAYVKGTCPPDSAASIRAHLADCPRCRQWVDDARANEVLLESVRALLDKDRPSRPATPGLNPDLQFIEGYEVLEEIGRGGMGVVYKARQVGTRRTVALKVLLEGPLASDSDRRRFEREIELAASLSHPNIVAIHDSGLSRGRYYFAMDYIEGQRLDRYSKARDLPVEQRLRLMQKICLAVNYAHQRGVIHRDLKPSNILVDTQGEPHLLDFGLAKTTHASPHAESLLLSVSGEVLGTLPYMAPEQALGSPRDVDSRTDVYTLGVILYEALTGRYPYPVVGQMADVLKNIAQAKPARPSTIYRAIRNDLETIVLKTLSKDKADRYDSAGALAADIGRYMAGEAVEAKRDSGWYVLRKTLRRYKLPVGIVAAVLVAALVVAVSMSSLYTRAEHQRQIAHAASTQAVAARQQAESTSRDLAGELHTRRIEQGRSLVLAGDIAQGEYILWREFLQQPGDLQSLWALRETYATQPCLAKALASTRPLCSVAFAPDGTKLATADVAGALKLWDVPACKLTSTILTQAPDVTSLAFAPDGQTLACISSDQTVRLLDTATGRCAAKLSPPPGPAVLTTQDSGLSTALPASCRPANRLAFSPNGNTLASCAARDVILWDLATGQPLATLSAHKGPVSGVAFSPDGRTIASAGFDHTVILWDVETRQPRATLDTHLDTVSCVAFSPDGRLLASASWDGTIVLWQTSDGTCLASLEDSGCWIHSVAFAPDGRTLAAGDIHGNVKLWDLSTGRCTATIPAHVEGLAEPLKPVVTLAYSPHGDILATASTLGILKIWDVSAARPMLALPGHAGSVLAARFAPDGKTLVSRDERGSVRLWDLSTGQCTAAIANALPAPATAPAVDWDNPDLADAQQSLACSPVGKLLAWPDGHEIVLHDAVTGRQLARLTGHTDRVLCLVFSPDGHRLASGAADGQIRLWNTSSLQCVKTHAGPQPATSVSSLAFSPDGSRLAAVSGNTIEVWDSADDWKACIQSRDGRIRTIAFSPDGHTLAYASDSGVTRWDLASNRLTDIEGAAGTTYSLAFSPDGRTLASADHNRTIRLWQLPSGRCIATLQAGPRLAWSLTFSPDGRMLAAAGAGDSLRLFNLAHYDRHVLGNYPFYLELAHRSPDLLQKVNREELTRWAKTWASETELPLWASRAAASQPDPAIDPRLIADWGQLTRHRLLSALRSLGHKPLQTRLPVDGAMDPPTAWVMFQPAQGDTRIHTLLGSGNSPDRTRAAQYQQQRLRPTRPGTAAR